MPLLPADYVLIGLAVVMALTGLFRGFSGTLAFLVASAVTAGGGVLTWSYSESVTVVPWQRIGLTAVVSLLVFGLSRVLVSKTVHKLLAQPADAVFGFLAELLIAALVVVGWAYSGIGLEHSNLVREVANYVR